MNMALLTAFGGYAIFVVVRRLLPRAPSSVVLASGIAAAAMVGVHALIGIGEGVITGLVIGAVLATRPDLVWGERDLALDQAPTGSVPERVAS